METLATKLIDLDKIDLPADARAHDAEDVDSTAQDMHEEGLLQEIVVELVGDRYEALAGVGRVLAARKLGWTQIRASIRQGLTEFEKARITFSENDKRQDPYPLFQAGRLSKMLDTPDVKNQTDLAQRLGKSVGWVSDHLAFLKFPEEAKKVFSALNISFNALQAVKSLPTPDLQSQVAEELDGGKLNPQGVEKRCRQLRISSSHAPSLPRSHAQPASDLTWKGDEIAINRHFKPAGESVQDYIAWLTLALPTFIETKPVNKNGHSKMAAAPSEVPTDAAEVEKMAQPVHEAERGLMESFKPKLPANPEEEKELQEIAAKAGPKGVYTWIYGADSIMTKAVPAATWEEMGITPADGLRQVLNGIKKFGAVA